MRKVNRRIIGEGEIDFPCIPSLLEPYMTKLLGLWDVYGKRLNEDQEANLRRSMQNKLVEGYRASPNSRLVVGFQVVGPPRAGVAYIVKLKIQTMDELYAEWVADRKPPLFGKLPDAKVMEMAERFADPAAAPVLDIGSGTGRNAFPLARRGHPTHAIEPVPALVAELRKGVASENVPIEVIEGDIRAAELALKPNFYKLVILAEVIPHFADAGDVRTVFAKLADALEPGGLVLASSFLTTDGYKPDSAAREVAHSAWCGVFTRSELDFITDELPFDKISDESVHDYEKEHLDSGGWPPTGWFVEWSQGGDLFEVPTGKAPVELRWLVYRRR
jgi:SAM-dependent methyltransferase